MTGFDALKKIFASLRGGGAEGNASGEMIPCEEAMSRLFEFLDGELDEDSTAEIRKHVDVCKACYPRFQFEKEFLDALHRAQEEGGAAPDLKDRILKALADEGMAEV